MEDLKFCNCCHKPLGSIDSMSYYKFIRLKYCPDCAKLNKKLKDQNRAREVRRAVKEKHKAVEIELELQREKNELLRKENELLKKHITSIREMT